jgi:hypothetical protein
MSDTVANKADVLEGKEPAFIRGTSAIQYTIDVLFESLEATFCWILMLMIRFRLPSACHVGTEDILDVFTDLDLGAVTDEASWSATEANDVEKFILELLLGFHGQDIGDKCFATDEKLSTSSAVIDSRCVGVDLVGGKVLWATWDV